MTIKPYKKKDGKTYYMFKISFPKDPLTGKRKQTVRRGFETKKDAEIAYLRLLAEEDIISDGSALKFKDVYKIWLDVYKLKVKESTLAKTISIFKIHILPELGEQAIKSIKYPQLQNLVNRWAEKLVNFSVVKNYTSNVFDHAMRIGEITENPCRLIILPRKEPKAESTNYYSVEELNEFLHLSEIHMPFKWYVFFRLLAYTGMRKGEVLALSWNDVNFKKNQIYIRKTLSMGLNGKRIIQSPKTVKSIRTLDIDSVTMNFIETWRFEQLKLFSKLGISAYNKDTFIFATLENKIPALQAPVNALNSFYDKVNLELRRITVHGFRHTHCSILFESGASIQEVQARLGHSNIQTTMNIYTHVSKKKKQETAERFFDYLAGQSGGQ